MISTVTFLTGEYKWSHFSNDAAMLVMQTMFPLNSFNDLIRLENSQQDVIDALRDAFMEKK